MCPGRMHGTQKKLRRGSGDLSPWWGPGVCTGLPLKHRSYFIYFMHVNRGWCQISLMLLPPIPITRHAHIHRTSPQPPPSFHPPFLTPIIHYHPIACKAPYSTFCLQEKPRNKTHHTDPIDHPHICPSYLTRMITRHITHEYTPYITHPNGIHFYQVNTPDIIHNKIP